MSAAFLYALVIVSAIAHPVWNAMVKSSGGRALSIAAIRLAGLVLGLAALPFVDWPAPESWKWLLLTDLAHFAYYALLIRSYDVGDMSVVYPLARGMVGYAVLARRRDLVPYARRHGRAGLLAGVISVLGFLAFLTAARSLPLGPVTALRETSVIFGALIGALVLKEGFGLRRVAASASVACGIALLAALG